jgi:hypothetical protein
VTELADRKDVSLRVAAYAIALERIVAAMTPARHRRSLQGAPAPSRSRCQRRISLECNCRSNSNGDDTS